MQEIIISANDSGQRLDRFLKKYFANAPLSSIYKIIRKDVKIDGRRQKEDYMLSEGDVLQLYLSGAEIESWSKKKGNHKLKRQFSVIFEDDNIIIVNKPFGLLVHGDKSEKKDTLANQVIDYLIESGVYNPRTEKSFTPGPANRLDRNTTGTVVFGKNAAAQRELARIFREDGCISKYYYTIVHGLLKQEKHLKGKLLRDEEKNISIVLKEDSERGKYIETIVRPMFFSSKGYTFAEIELITGRSHQIRAHLASIRHPLAGDTKYGGKAVKIADAEFDLGKTTQALHAYKIKFNINNGPLEYLDGKTFTAEPPKAWMNIIEELFGKEELEKCQIWEKK